MAIELNEEIFDQHVLGESKIAVVDFWAEWCGPCRIVGPILDELSTEYEGKVLIGKVNVDDNAGLTSRYKVMNIPTMLFLKNGEVVDKLIGAANKATITQKIDSLL